MTNLRHRRFAPVAPWACGCLLACGSGTTGTATDAAVDSANPGDAAGDAGKRDSGTTEAGPSKAPIKGLVAETWTWVPFADALCRDGSSTGIGVNLGKSDHLMIFLEGGGACFNYETCLSGNPSSFSEKDFKSRAASAADGSSLNTGILDRTNPANPVKDWSFVYVPYCTGDIHGGDNVATVAGVGSPPTPQHFVGYVNVGLYLDRVVPTFPKTGQVLLAGMSAGGFGAAVNYARVAKAFAGTPVTMLDDSGPFMENPYLATCLQSENRTLWGLDHTVLPECGGDCKNPASYFIDYVKHIAKAYPKVNFGLADSTDDNTITQFFGFGSKNCTGSAAETEATFTAGLLDIRAQLASESNFGEFIFRGSDHTTIQNANFYSRTAGGGGGAEGGADGGADAGAGVRMTDWVSALLGGAATSPGP